MQSLPSQGLDAFYATAQLGHFTKAAEKLHITQSALSQRIHSLESQLGTAVFVRDRKGLRLTEMGRRLLIYCQHRNVLESDLLENVRTENLGEITGSIRIAGFSSVVRSVVLPAASRILKSNPKVTLQTYTCEMRDLPNMLRSGQVDYLLLDYEWQQGGVESQLLGVEENVLIQGQVDKTKNVFIDHDEDDQTTFRYLKEFDKAALGKMKRIFLDDIYGIIDGVKLGMGKAVVSKHLVEGESKIKILNPTRVLKSSVYLHFYSQPFYTSLHGAILEQLGRVPLFAR